MFRLKRGTGALRRGWRNWLAWSTMARRLGPYVGRQRGRLGTAFLLGIGYTLMGLAEPWPLKLILDNVLLGRPVPGWLDPVFPEVEGNRIPLLVTLSAAIVAIAGLRGFFYYYQKLSASRVGQQVTADMRLDLYRHLQRLSLSFHDRRRTGDILSRLTGDIRFLRDIFISLPLDLTTEIMLVTGMIVVMFAMDWRLTLIALVTVPVLGFVLRTYQGPMRKAIRRQREREGDIASIAAEVLGAIRVVQGFGRERHEVDRFTVENKRSLRTGLKASRLEAKLRWYSELTVAVVTALVIGVAARRVLTGVLSPGDLIVFASYLRVFNRPLRRISRMAERAARGAAAGERVLEILELEPDVADVPGARRLKRVTGDVRLEGVSFRYQRGGPEVLHEVDLHVAAGERVALVGPTGAGKSSILNLIPRFYDPAAGRVLLDGSDLREIRLASLREHMALVFQEPVLFAATVAENIAYGRPGADRDEIVEAARRAGIHDIVDALPEGYDTVLGERGGTLSGGQRQGVAIARAMIKDAPVVLLDEPTVGLDRASTDLVVRALDRLMEGRTVIMVSHDLSTLRDMDRLVVVENGRITGSGPHRTLLAENPVYRSFHRAGAEEVS